MAQSAAPQADSELIDVVSIFNGGYPYLTAKPFMVNRFADQLQTISRGRLRNAFFSNDLSDNGSAQNRRVELVKQ